MSILSPEEVRFYRSEPGERRAITRAALKRWRSLHPDKLPVRPLHHGWYGWVLESTAGDRGIVGAVLADCIVPYLREQAKESGS